MCLGVSVCVHTYVHTNFHVDKNRLLSALLLEKLLLSVICCLLFEFKSLQCGLLHPVSYTDTAIHAFPDKMQKSPWPPKYFLLSFNSTPHPRLCMRLCGQTRLCMLRGMQTVTCCAECHQLVWEPTARLILSTLNWSTCSVRTGYVFFRTLVTIVIKVIDMLGIFVCFFLGAYIVVREEHS